MEKLNSFCCEDNTIERLGEMFNSLNMEAKNVSQTNVEERTKKLHQMLFGSGFDSSSGEYSAGITGSIAFYKDFTIIHKETRGNERTEGKIEVFFGDNLTDENPFSVSLEVFVERIKILALNLQAIGLQLDWRIDASSRESIVHLQRNNSHLNRIAQKLYRNTDGKKIDQKIKDKIKDLKRLYPQEWGSVLSGTLKKENKKYSWRPIGDQSHSKLHDYELTTYIDVETIKKKEMTIHTSHWGKLSKTSIMKIPSRGSRTGHSSALIIQKSMSCRISNDISSNQDSITPIIPLEMKSTEGEGSVKTVKV
jgi:hypothetical protein